MIKKLFSACMIVCALYSLVSSKDITDGSGLPGEYLIGLAGDAHEFGRGGGSTALVDNTASIYHNPAGLGLIKYMEMLLTYTRVFNGYNLYNGAYAYPFGKYGTLGIGLTGFISPEGIGYDEFGIPTGEKFNENSNTIFLSYGKLFLDRFGIGANVKISTQDISDYFGMGFGFDIGLSARAFDWLVFGLTMMHLGGPRITLDSDEDQFSSTVKFGIGSQLLHKTLSINADVHVLELFPDENAYSTDRIVRPIRWSAGVEYRLIQYLALRAGINGSIDYSDGTSGNINMFTFGPGFKVKQFSADYAFIFQTEEKDFRSEPAHCFSLRYQFGKPIPEKEEELETKLQNAGKLEIMHKVEQLYIQGYFQKAYDQITLLNERHPKDSEIKQLFEQVRVKLATEKSDDLFLQARNEFENKNYDHAAELLKQIIELSPDNQQADSLRQKVLAIKEISGRIESVKKLFAQKQFEEMAGELDIILGVDSTNEEARLYKDKISDFLIKRNADKGYTLAYKYYYDDKNVEKANSELQKVLAIKPDHKEANKLYKTISSAVKKMYLRKVGQMVSKDNLDVDNDALKNLIKIDIQDQLVQARRQYDSKQYSQALASVEAVLQNDEKNQQAVQLKDDILNAQGFEKAELFYNEALKFFNEKKLDAAEKKVTETLNLAPKHEKAQKLLNEVQTLNREKNLTAAKKKMGSGERKDLEESQKMVKDYLAVDSENKRAQKLLIDIQTDLLILDANAHIDKDEYEKADRVIQKALALNPDNEKVKDAFKNIKEVIDVFSE